jgi:ankyrin repeat protein
LFEAGAGVDTLHPAHGETASTLAAYKGHVGVLELLSEFEYPLHKPDVDGATPAYIAAQEGQTAALEYLIQNGADLTLRTCSLLLLLLLLTD